jgi:uncharacterized phage protein (TIGR01671 family)
MDREIICRGKRVDNGEWVFGFYYYSVRYKADFIKVSLEDGDAFIEYDIEVFPESVGQFTGFYTRDRKTIFEGDIMREWLEDSVEPEGGYYAFNVVNFQWGSWCLLQIGFDYSKSDYEDFTKLYEGWDNAEVIGNIHDNNELIEKEVTNG